MLFDFTTVTPETIGAVTEETIAVGEALVASVLTIEGPRTFSNTIAPLEETGRNSMITYAKGAFFGYVSDDEATRDAGRESEVTLDKWGLDLVARREIYDAVHEFARSEEAASLTGEEAHVLDRLLLDFRMAGHELELSARERVAELRNRMVELGIDVLTNIAEYDDGIEVTRQDLEGLPDAYIDSLRPGASKGMLRISLDYPDVIPFFDNSPRRDLREALSFKFSNRAANTNTSVLDETLAIRAEIAGIFGLASWAHYSMQVKMAKRPEAVDAFYADLLAPLQSGAATEIEALEARLVDDGHSAPLQPWDRAYYHTQQMKEDYGVNPLAVASYFPINQAIDGVLAITQKVFGLTYEELPDAPVWHEDVRTFRVTDTASGKLVSHFYMDLFPREGKYSHAAAFPLYPSGDALDGSTSRPISAIVANFTKPTTDAPSLLQHDEVVTLFHEFGHILHMSLSQARFARFSSANTEWDFVEAPSQIMENWCWIPDVLERFARHHETGEPIPSELIHQLVAARDLNVSIFTLRQMLFGQIDMDLHSSLEPIDAHAVLHERSKMALLPFHEGTFFLASFGHILGGYDAGYYGYLWSSVFGEDMFSRFDEIGPLSPEVGMAYRREILEPNGTLDADALLRNFLGREPNNEAFLEKLGITA